MKQSKNQLRRARKKAQKVEAAAGAPDEKPQTTSLKTQAPVPAPQNAPADLDASLPLEPSDPLWDIYKGIASKFDETASDSLPTKQAEKPEVYFDDGDEIPDEDEEAEPKISKKKRKEMNKLSVAELKAMVRKPEIVEWTDTSAPDPRLLIHIKAHRNVVPVPSHWSLKREYLSSKRGWKKRLSPCLNSFKKRELRKCVTLLWKNRNNPH
ncbi:hypothetical protein N7474_001472 [Penicillium riverlandense]|uniref:uncharacterized protein n=1 Tax=Penicillium riverlandense TaxID=1903569 RepID=UPI002546C97F|nr:uncharacterized protein N7474_001472 [Penicillium riverlandense]KAJ5833161.1 hypothetical protein N7474_001472 [Penicillium riverlandense]